jgi:hypothetical protein
MSSFASADQEPPTDRRQHGNTLIPGLGFQQHLTITPSIQLSGGLRNLESLFSTATCDGAVMPVCVFRQYLSSEFDSRGDMIIAQGFHCLQYARSYIVNQVSCMPRSDCKLVSLPTQDAPSPPAWGVQVCSPPHSRPCPCCRRPPVGKYSRSYGTCDFCSSAELLTHE